MTPCFAKVVTVKVNFHETKRDPKVERELIGAVNQILEFSNSNHLGVKKSEQFIAEADVYGSKFSFDKFIEASPNWKAGVKVPATYVGIGEKKKLFVVSWPVYQGIHPNDSRHEYGKLIVHESAHLFHVAYLKGDEEKMGPMWFFEGFACFVADQYREAVLPRNFASVINTSERGNYKDYVAIFSELRKKYSVRELLDKAHDKDFNNWAISTLRQ